MQRLGEGLWRWTGLHPRWEPGPDEALSREVGCVYHESDDAVVLVDPVVPPEDAEHFLTALDRDVERAGHPLVILLTSPWHARSAVELAERYAGEVLVHGEDPRLPLPGARQFALGDALPGGVETFDAHFHGEALLWIADRRTLVAGDVLLGSPDGLRLAPDDWLPEEEREGRLRRSLAFLAELTVERVLVGHGDPVLEDARGALERALHAPSAA